MRLHIAAGLNRWVKSAEAKTLHGSRLDIGARLILGFVLIILSMLAADAVILWQFHLVRTEAERLNGIDQKLVAVLRVHTSLLAFHDRLEELADAQDDEQLVAEGERLRSAVLDDSRGAISAFSLSPSDFQRDPTILPILHAVQSALPAQLEAITTLANAGDWRAVRQRLANQVTAMQAVTLGLVEKVDHEVGEEQAQTVGKIKRVQRLVFLVVPLTAVFTLLIAGTFGLAITRSITQPLARLVEGSKALARGDFQHQVPVTGRDELADLGQVFNETAGRLQDLYATLQQSEAYLAEAQRLSKTGSFGWIVSTGEIRWSEETFRIFQYDRAMKPTVELILRRVHPEDVASVQQTVARAMEDGKDFEHEYRLVMPDGAVKHVHVVARALNGESGTVEFVGAVMDVTERKQAEETLRRSEGYLAEAQRLSHTGTWASKPAIGVNTYWSEECYRLMGFDPHGGQPGFETVLQRFHPDDQAKVREAVETAEREKSDFELDYRIIHPGGEIRDIHVIGHPVLSPSGDFVEFVGTVMDITERKRAEDRTRLIIDTVPAQLWTESPDGVVDFVNRRWIDYTGMTLEQAVGSGWNRMVHPDDIERVLSKWRTLISEGKPREIETRLRRSDGTYRWFLSRVCPLVDRSGRILGWYGSDTDIHDRKEAEETLRRSEGYLAEAQRLSQTGSWAWTSATDDITYLSEECYRVLGFDPHEGLPRVETFFQRIHPNDQARSVEQFEKASREKTEFEFDYRIVHAGGSVRDIHTVGHPVFRPTGDFVEFVGTVIDITERKRAEEERERLRQAQADLAHVNRVTTMGELTASLAHEVNQPIAAAVTSANSCLHWLAADIPNLDKARASAERIVKDGTRAAEIISRIRLLFQKGTQQLELVDVNEVVEEMIALLLGEAMRYTISVRTELAANLPKVMGDRVQLQQVVMNLMTNGIDAMKGLDGTRELIITSQLAENDQLLVSVSDTGVGLPAQQADQIFNAFFTTKPQGTGMGLRISRSIVESHGGRLWAANNSPRGASFRFAIPAKTGAKE